MREAPLEGDGDGDASDREVVVREDAELTESVEGLSPGDIDSGARATQLLSHALGWCTTGQPQTTEYLRQ